jgi:hypothetical protein
MVAKRYLVYVLTAIAIAAGRDLRADDAYYWMPASALNVAPELPDRWWPVHYQVARHYQPYIVLEGSGEAYVTGNDGYNVTGQTTNVAIRAPEGQPVKGTLYWPRRAETDPARDELVSLKFEVPTTAAAATNLPHFLRAKAQHYQRLADANLPGGAWFRHQIELTRRELGIQRDDPTNATQRPFFPGRESNLEQTYALVSGGRALSENLQLDRILPAAAAGVPTVDVDEITGITVREYQWKVDDLQPDLDPLAKLIPDDQHVLLFPSFAALVELADYADKFGTPILNLAQPRSESARSRERYEQQLGISLTAAARALGPQLVSSVAMTGSDPYFRTGTDVAVLFQSPQAGVLKPLLESQIRLSSKSVADAAAVNGTVASVEYSGLRSPDREVCTYVAAIGDVVVVTNSLEQLAAISAVGEGGRGALAALPEFKFFRDRYRRDEAETALLLISDKTIRRWCGPKWRIATARRTQAVAVMADLQAANFDRLVSGQVAPGPVYSDRWQHLVGELQLAPAGISSADYGSLEFQTPIVELDVRRVTENEKQMYERWRDGYQSNWSNFFDPIAVRFVVDDGHLAADLTVMPLIAGSEYNEMIRVSKGAAIKPDSGDPHEGALVHFAMAINRQSEMVRRNVNLLSMFAPQVRVDPLSWIGETVAVYAEDDPVWQELAKAADDEFVLQNFHRFPVALYVEVQSGLRLTAFLAGVRAFVEQTAPGMTVWESKEHAGQPYVKVSPSARARQNEPDLPEEAGLYYSAGGDRLLVTINEGLLHRALDRYAQRDEAKADGQLNERDGPAWLGDNVCLQVDRRVLEFFDFAFTEQYQRVMQNLAWNNLPILNEWKRRYPGQDPVALHEKFWQTRLVAPGGGEYVWNDEWQTMESTLYGHPAQPKVGPAFPEALMELARGNFGLTFEEDGLRTRVDLTRKRQ